MARFRLWRRERAGARSLGSKSNRIGITVKPPIHAHIESVYHFRRKQERHFGFLTIEETIFAIYYLFILILGYWDFHISIIPSDTPPFKRSTYATAALPIFFIF